MHHYEALGKGWNNNLSELINQDCIKQQHTAHVHAISYWLMPSFCYCGYDSTRRK